MEYVFYNDTKVVFLSPAVPEEPEAYNLTVLIRMDGHCAPLRTEAGVFEYVADPTFENFTGGVKKQVNKLIHARVRRPLRLAWGPGSGGAGAHADHADHSSVTHPPSREPI
jgi:hypothetical protein